MDNIKKVAIYLRTSRNIAVLKNRLVDCCKEKQWRIYAFYIDQGYSGKNLDRPKLKKMLKDSKNSNFNAILVYDLTMLSVRTKDILKLFYILKEKEIDLFTLDLNEVLVPVMVLQNS